jgi:hypothetical protein
MLQPKKSNPNQKTKRLIPKSKVPTSYDVDWNAVRSANDKVMFLYLQVLFKMNLGC